MWGSFSYLYSIKINILSNGGFVYVHDYLGYILKVKLQMLSTWTFLSL